MKDFIIVIITAIFSGLVATIATLYWNHKERTKDEKRKILTILMSKRYDIVSMESVNALNMIDVVFYTSISIRKAWQEFMKATELPESQTRPQLINDKYLRLLEEIAKDIGYNNLNWEDIKHYYIPIGLSNSLQEEATLRRVQIDAGLAQINASNTNNGSNQATKHEEMANKLIIEAMKNPDGLAKLVEFSNKVLKEQQNK